MFMHADRCSAAKSEMLATISFTPATQVLENKAARLAVTNLLQVTEPQLKTTLEALSRWWTRVGRAQLADIQAAALTQVRHLRFLTSWYSSPASGEPDLGTFPLLPALQQVGACQSMACVCMLTLAVGCKQASSLV
jgi:hypothetical protein